MLIAVSASVAGLSRGALGDTGWWFDIFLHGTSEQNCHQINAGYEKPT